MQKTLKMQKGRPSSLILILGIILQAGISVDAQCASGTPFQCGLSTTAADYVTSEDPAVTTLPTAITAPRAYIRCVTPLPALISVYFTCPLGSICISNKTSGIPGAVTLNGGTVADQLFGPCIVPPPCSAANVGKSIPAGPTACPEYYFCASAAQVLGPFTCSGGQHFSANRSMCAPPAEARCDPSATTLAPATNATGPATNATSPSSTATNATSPQTPSTAASSPSSSSPSSPSSPSSNGTTAATPRPSQPAPECEGSGRLADPNSCRHFYRCNLLGRRTRSRCPFRFRFDTDAGRCRGRDVDCGDRPN